MTCKMCDGARTVLGTVGDKLELVPCPGCRCPACKGRRAVPTKKKTRYGKREQICPECKGTGLKP